MNGVPTLCGLVPGPPKLLRTAAEANVAGQSREDVMRTPWSAPIVGGMPACSLTVFNHGSAAGTHALS